MKAIFGLALVLLVLIMIAYASIGPTEPANYVNNKTYSNFSNLIYSYEILRYPSSVEIVDFDKLKENMTLGFATDSWNINFGSIPGNGTFVERKVEFSNKKDSPTKVDLKSYGNITPLIHFSQSSFILEPGEKVSVGIYLFSNNTDFGNYSGEVDVIVKKAIYNFFPLM